MEIKKIAFGNARETATRELLARLPALRRRGIAASADLEVPLDRAGRGLEALAALDGQCAGPIAIEGTGELVAAILSDLARVDAVALREGDPELLAGTTDGLLGVAAWALRHEVTVVPVEPVVNALARRANGTRGKAELAAVFALTQAVLAQAAPRLSADLERSNPERPWRILHANLAIIAIRTEDAAMMEHAFDALDEALPGERAGFYAEALALALSPGVDRGVRERIEARHLKWTAAR